MVSSAKGQPYSHHSFSFSTRYQLTSTMVSTRLQTGTINTRKYTPLSISLHDLSLSSPTTPTRSNYRKNGPNTPTKTTKPISPRKAGRKGSLASPKPPKQKLKSTSTKLSYAELQMLDTSPRTYTGRTRETPTASLARSRGRPRKNVTFSDLPKMPADMCPGNAVFPSAIFGAREDVGLSKIARADREINMWEEILVTHQQNIPDLAPIVEEKLQEARERRARLDEKLEANTRVGDIDPAATAIKQRLETLQWALDTSKFGPEAENIKCAISGYKSGAITYSGHYTLIYSGHIVDTAPTYHSFVLNRTERLDRYFSIHGEGWLWYEPPLNVPPESKPILKAAATLQRANEWSSLGSYHVNQGFWKRSGFVRRMAQTQHAQPSINEPFFLRDPADATQVDCQFDGPRLSFRSLLDSGATFPSLHTEDLHALGIDMNTYAAQCVEVIQTASGTATTRIWEMFVCVLDEQGKQLVDPSNAVWPLSHHYLGALCPVVESVVPMSHDPEGREIANRLSGMVPFVACYVTSAPTRDFLFLGEDRNDVLGSHRMPGQKKWTIELPIIQPGMPFDRYGNPKTRFNHRNGLIVDEDHETIQHCSTITFLGGTEQEVIITSNPGSRQIGEFMAGLIPGGGGMPGGGGA